MLFGFNANKGSQNSQNKLCKSAKNSNIIKTIFQLHKPDGTHSLWHIKLQYSEHKKLIDCTLLDSQNISKSSYDPFASFELNHSILPLFGSTKADTLLKIEAIYKREEVESIQISNSSLQNTKQIQVIPLQEHECILVIEQHFETNASKTPALEKQTAQAALDVEGIGVIEIVNETNECLLSEHAITLLGFSNQKTRYLADLFEHIHPNDRRAAKVNSALILSGSSKRHEAQYQFMVNGSWAWRKIKGSLLSKQESGTPEKYILTISESLQPKHNETSYEQEIEQALTLKNRAERSAKIRHLTISLEKKDICLFDYPRNNPLNPEKRIITIEKFLQTVDPSYNQIFNTILENLTENNLPSTYEFKTDGEELAKWFSITITSCKYANGNPTTLSGNIQDITAIKRIEESLKKRLLTLNSAESLAKMGSYTHYDNPQISRWWSLGMCAIFDLPAKECQGKKVIQNYLLSSFIEPFKEHTEKARTTGHAVEATYQIRSEKGIIKPVRVIHYPIYSSNDQVVGTGGNFQDITEIEVSNQRLEASMKEQEIVLNNIKSGLVFINPDLTLKWANSVHINNIKRHNKGSETPPEKELCYVSRNRKAPCPNCPTLKALTSKKPETAQVKSEDGETYQIFSSPVIDRSGDCIGVVESYDNITHIVKYESDLQLAKARTEKSLSIQKLISETALILLQERSIKNLYKYIIHNLTERLQLCRTVIYKYNKDDKKYSVESSKERTSQDENLSKYEEIPYAILERREPNIQLRLSLDQTDLYEEERDFLERNNLHEILTVKLLVGSEVYGYIRFDRCTTTDAWKELDLLLINSMVTIIELGIERQNTENNLITARDKAEESDRLKTAFLASMSHEIRTPLNGIVGFASLALQENYTKEQKAKFGEMIKYNSELLIDLVNDILDLAKIESGAMIINNSLINLDEFCQRVVDLKSISLPENVTFKYDIGAHNISLFSDENRLMQVVLNLISNAQKFTKKGEIELGFYPTEGEEKIIFYVKDSGIGIPAKKMPNIFDRFIKLNPHIQGTGLGLSICKAILQNLSGKIWVESEIGAGSTFFFSIPNLTENPIKNLYKISKIQPQVRKPLAIRKKVLIAEDNQTNFQLLKAILDPHFDTVWAENGRRAYQLFSDEPIDLILMDLKMPIMDGIDTTIAIRKTSKIPIIVVSAEAYVKDKVRASEAGCNDFLIKPFDQDQLIEKIFSWL